LPLDHSTSAPCPHGEEERCCKTDQNGPDHDDPPVYASHIPLLHRNNPTQPTKPA
jgi:hypothetical protein